MRKLLSGIALAAFAVTVSYADPPGGRGNSGGQQQERGNGGGQDRGPVMQMNGPGRGNGNGNGNGNAGRDRGPAMEMPGNRGNGRGAERMENQPRPAQIERGPERGAAARGPDRAMPVQAQVPGRSDDRMREDGNRGARPAMVEVRRPDWRSFDQRGLINGCPPGLAKKNNGCTPPGLLKQAPAYSYPATWWGLRGISDLSGYRYYNGDLVRLSPAGGIVDYYPLLGGSLAIGNTWPSAWQPTPLDPYYTSYYGLGDDYRYFDGAIYNVDPTTSAIEAIAALLTGDTFTVGQRMPLGYDVYNVPYEYRSRYVDGPDAYYRYSDGYIYQVDPKTQLIVEAIQLLAGR
ncbi:MAG: hypothetical protein ACKOOL_07360 [Novosphingobium sp.]